MQTQTEKSARLESAENRAFSEALKKIMADFPERSQLIVFARYGVFSPSSMTLEEIGKKYGITRERVRQVIREALKKMRDKNGHPVFEQVRERVILALEKNGGIMKEKQLLSALGKGVANEEAAARFLLECIDSIVANEIKDELEFSYSLPGFDLGKWKNVKNKTISVLEKHRKPLHGDELFELLAEEVEELIASKDDLGFYLEVSAEIKKNNFGKWGISKWKEISPKGTREKAYLILKEVGKPLHFREIAKKIDLHNLNKKKTHAQTVHNELIKDGNFVLVGRGIYALSEWGYKKGTVKDVIDEIIAKSSKPLSKEEIIRKVLEMRHVKKSTVVINLNNFFHKDGNGAYVAKKK